MNSVPQKKPSRKSVATRAKWQQHVTAQPASGLTQSAYCREHGLNAKYFSLWKRKLREPSEVVAGAATDRAPAFIPVIVKPVPSSPARATRPASRPAEAGHLIIKATLRNGVAIKVHLPSASGVPSILSQLAQLPC